MGGFLDQPNREKQLDKGSNQYLSWGACEMQGWRSSMEDTHICELVVMPNKDDFGMLFGVFDGHGGTEVSQYAREHFKKTFQRQAAFKKSDFKQALISTMMDLDQQIKGNDWGSEAGATACVVFVTNDKILCANSGDSRAVLCQNK